MSAVIRRRQLLWLKSYALRIWLTCIILAAVLLIEYRVRVLHPSFVPVALLLAFLTVLFVLLVGTTLIELILSKQKGAVFGWFMAGILPLGLFYAPLEYAREQHEKKEVPKNWAMGFSQVFAAALMDGQAVLTFPNRLETERLVMFYKDLPHPKADIDAIDAHCARLERMLNVKLRAKIHWFRGPLLGQSNTSFMGLALGSPDSQDKEMRLDRHELAHAVLDEQRPFEADPPMVLHEGWAECQSGLSEVEAAHRAIGLRDTDTPPWLFNMFEPPYYHLDKEPVYTVGASYVSFYIRKYGAMKFREYYNNSRPGNRGSLGGLKIGPHIKNLETEFWLDTRRLAAKY